MQSHICPKRLNKVRLFLGSWGLIACVQTSPSHRKKSEANAQNLSVEVYSIFAGGYHRTLSFEKSHLLTACTVLSMRTEGAVFEPLFCFVFFMGNVNRREYLKNHSLKFEEICQKSCSYSSVNDSLKIYFGQRTFATRSSFYRKNLYCLLQQRFHYVDITDESY